MSGTGTPQARLSSTILESELEYVNPIGSGGSGEVWKVLWHSVERGEVEAAAKKLPIIPGQTDLAELKKEIRFLERLKHANIIEYYGHCVTSDYVIIVTEYATNGSLHCYLKDNSHLPPERIASWAKQIARGIQYLSKMKIVHRDLKPDNLLITAGNVLKICDFGISKDVTSTTTTENPDKGTIRWLAPEVFKDSKLSRKADLFAFGIMLWQLVTCEVPYANYDNYQVMYGVGDNGLRPKIPTNCPDILRDLMKRCWQENRKKRPTIDIVIRKIESYESMIQPRTQCIVRTSTKISACHWLDENHLAVGTMGRVEVYEMTPKGAQLTYALTSDEWEGLYIRGVAVNESLPDSMLVICHSKPYVYRHPCPASYTEATRYAIKGNQVEPKCIVVNSRLAVIGLDSGDLVVCKMTSSLSTDFDEQYRVPTNANIRDLGISSDHLLVVHERQLVVRSLRNLDRIAYRIEPPAFNVGLLSLQSACFCHGDRQIYVGCTKGQMGFVYGYKLDGTQYVTNTGCIAKKVKVWVQGLMSVSASEAVMTSNGRLAATGRFTKEFQVFNIV